MEESEKKEGKKPTGGIAISVALSFMLFFYAPLEMYFSNISEFWFDFPDMIPVITITFVIMLGACCLFFEVLKRISLKIYRLGVAGFLAITICSYIQGNFLLGNLPPLDGSRIDWNEYAAGRVETIICWGAVVAGIVILIRLAKWERFCKIVKGIGICMTLLLAVTITTLGISTEGFASKLNVSTTTEGLFEVSENKNFIILLLDAVDAGEFSRLMEENQEYKEIFADFTYYENTLAAYPYTMLSIPFILYGEWYENEKPFEDYHEEAYTDSALLNTLEEDGYKMTLYEESIPDSECICRFANMVTDEVGISSSYTFAKWQILLAGFKYAPFDLKRLCLAYPEKFRTLMELSEGYAAFTASNAEFYEGVQSGKWSSVPDNCFKFIHIEGGHVPFCYDKDVQLVENGTYQGNLEACMTITRAYLDKLREMDAYDNSVIIVMADHGFGDGDVPEGRQQPILFVKGIGEKHEPWVSQAPISYADLTEAYQRLLDGKWSDEVFDYQEGDSRERRYLFYYYTKESHLYEYLQSGNAGDESTLKATGREYILSP